jgi:hypothetical protein
MTTPAIDKTPQWTIPTSEQTSAPMPSPESFGGGICGWPYP